MTKPVVLLGSGGHARVLLDILQRSNIEILGLVDPHRSTGSLWLDCPVLGNDEIIFDLSPASIELVNGIGSLPGDAGLRAQLFSHFRSRGYRFKTLIDPLAFIAGNVVLKEGVQIMVGAIVQTGVSIGENSIINSGAIIEHDCQIGINVHIAPGSVLSGGVSVGDRGHIGTGATVIQNIRIGHDSVIGAGAVVTRDVANHQIVYPARSQIQDKT